MMFGGDHHVSHARLLGDLRPLVGVELDGIEAFGEFCVFQEGNPILAHNPLANLGHLLSLPGTGGHGVESPVDEHAEASFTPPRQALVALLVGFNHGRGIRFGVCEPRGQEETSNEGRNHEVTDMFDNRHHTVLFCTFGSASILLVLGLGGCSVRAARSHVRDQNQHVIFHRP